jgi:hypothetical protein
VTKKGTPGPEDREQTTEDRLHLSFIINHLSKNRKPKGLNIEDWIEQRAESMEHRAAAVAKAMVGQVEHRGKSEE